MYMCVFCDTMQEKVETIYPTSSNVFLNLLSKIDEKDKKKLLFSKICWGYYHQIFFRLLIYPYPETC